MSCDAVTFKILRSLLVECTPVIEGAQSRRAFEAFTCELTHLTPSLPHPPSCSKTLQHLHESVNLFCTDGVFHPRRKGDL